MEDRFIADVHLGKLARLLRLLGFDTLYKNNFTLNELLGISVNQERIVLSRNSSLIKNTLVKSFIIDNEDPLAQLKQVIEHFKLQEKFQPFSRCLVCNGSLTIVSKETIAPLIQKNTSEYFNEFWQCPDCKRIYWKGSHYETMIQLVDSMRRS